MSTKETEKKEKKTDPITELSDGKNDKSVDASSGAETEKEVTKNIDEKEAEMADKKEEEQDLKESGLGESAVAEDVKAAEKEKTEETGLAPGVTLDPQNEEQLDLNLMEDAVAVSRISVPTDDDEGEFLEDTEAVKELREFINLNNSEGGSGLRDAELLKIGTEITSSFNKKLSFKEALTLAALTKYRILFGMGLDIVYEVVKGTGQNWKYYYGENYIPSTYSSSDKYRKLSKIPNIICYAFLGLERLEKINTAIKGDYDMKGPDPFGQFFKDNSININLNESDLENFKYDVDAAVAKTRTNNLFEEMNKDVPEAMQVKNTVDLSLIDNLISEDKKIEVGLINDLYLYAKGGDDPNVLLKSLLKGGNKKASSGIKGKLTDIKTIKGFPRIVSELKLTISYLSKNTALIQKITPQHVKDLQSQVTALKVLIKAQEKAK
jgi:hypothetical protein